MPVIFIFAISASACKGAIKNTALKANEMKVDKGPVLSEIHLQREGMDVTYPWFIQELNGINPEQWNKIIEEDINSILEIYSFQPFPELSPSPGTRVPTLQITYDIKINDEQFFSVLYKADYYSPYSAYPTELVYTTNIDKRNDKRLRLSDLVRLDTAFVKNFRTWDFIPIEEANVEFNQAIKDYLAGISDEELLEGFNEGDQIGYENIWGIFSYITPSRLGISLGVPNYIGDHVEYERDFTDIEEFIIK